ncbi:MAG: carboxypeptidase-like regulatory domain-containing protein [Chitinophagaceae bacterium]|nr:carboxypeptidase-like regulatory domain-containing protein [Chitinophagaceae bacterium]
MFYLHGKHFIFSLLILFSLSTFSQTIHGTVYDDQGNLLPFSTILIKGTTQGTSANSQGKFVFSLSPGSYTLVSQHVGYTRVEKKINIDKEDQEITFILSLQKLQLKEVIVKSNAEDPAYAIIRQAIKKRNFYNRQVTAFECEAYIKGLIKLQNLPGKILGKKVPEEDRKSMHLDSAGKGIIYLSESITKVSVQQPGKFKLEVLSGRESGSNGFGFNFPTFINLYDNNVTMFTARINPRGFISPISDGALNFYKYEYMGSYFEDGKEINTIRVIPKRAYEPLFSGIINITENDWRIHSCDLLLTKSAQLEIIDTLRLTQIHIPVTPGVWRVKNQLVHFNFKQLGIDAIGDFINVYSKYNINPAFSKKYFDKIVVRYDTTVNKKTKAYWDSIRPVPLEPEEAKDYRIKDSIYLYAKDSMLSRQNIDSLRKKQGHIKLGQVFWSGISRTHYSKKDQYTWHFDPLLKKLNYNTVEGVVIEPSGNYKKYLKGWKTNLTVTSTLRYGFNNDLLNGWLDINFRTRDFSYDKKLKRETWDITGGKRVSQFNKESNITELGNTIGTLFSGKNNLKIYENYFGNISFSKRFEDGLRFELNALYEDRIPLDNTTDFIFYNKYKYRLTPNYPFRILSSQFLRHQALELDVDVSIKPGQRYIQFPYNKIPIGSKYPTFAFHFSHGFKNILGSDVDFDKWKFTLFDDANLKLAGSIKYKISVGGFLNSKSVFVQDLQHFNGNESHFAKEYLNTFQLLPYYSAYTKDNLYGLINFEHHLNGLLTNKIPLFKKLNWNLLDGANAIYVNSNNNYAEVFIGLENIFKVLRADVVASFQNGKTRIDYRIGLGGLLGGSITGSRARTTAR